MRGRINLAIRYIQKPTLAPKIICIYNSYIFKYRYSFVWHNSQYTVKNLVRVLRSISDKVKINSAQSFRMNGIRICYENERKKQNQKQKKNVIQIVLPI